MEKKKFQNLSMRIICFYIPVKAKRCPRGVLKDGISLISDTPLTTNNRCLETYGSAQVHVYVQDSSPFPWSLWKKFVTAVD